MDDALYLLKDGNFRRLPEPNHKPLGLVLGWSKTFDGNIWAEGAGNPESLSVSAISKCVKSFLRRRFQWAVRLRQTRTEESGSALEWRPCSVSPWRSAEVPGQSKGRPLSHQIVAQRGRLRPCRLDDGLFGLRQGKVQRMTMKNGLPCDCVISFIEDGEKRWWLNTQCGVVEFSDSELERWWANPEAVVQTHVYDVWTEPVHSATTFQFSGYSRMGACGL